MAVESVEIQGQTYYPRAAAAKAFAHAIGLEHSVANAFFLPLGMLYGADVTPMQIVTKNLLIVALGNLIGGGLLHAGGLSYQFGKLGEDD